MMRGRTKSKKMKFRRWSSWILKMRLRGCCQVWSTARAQRILEGPRRIARALDRRNPRKKNHDYKKVIYYNFLKFV